MALGGLVVLVRFAVFVADISFWYVASDVAYIFDAPPYVGLFSQVGLLMWSAAAAVSTFAAVALARGAAPDDRVGFFRATALLTAILLVDDAFLLHEIVVPSLFGVDELIPQAALGLSVLAWLVYSGRHLRPPPLALLAAIGFGAISAGLEVVEHIAPAIDHDFFEDGAKFLAIGCWLLFVSTEALAAVRANVSRR